MTKVGERTLEEVLISVLISTRKSRNCYTGYSSYYWDKSVPLMMMGITKNYYKFMGCDVYMINALFAVSQALAGLGTQTLPLRNSQARWNR